MADDINIVISVEDRDVIRARRHQNKLQAAVAQLEKEYRKGNITHRKYLSELNKQASALAKLGGSYNKAKSEVFTYAASLRKATDAQVRQAQSMAMAKRGMNKFGMVSQQVGYQVGDFFVQIQSGTSALVAFGQQGTQLAGLIPGIYGAIIGIGLAVGTMVLRTRQQMKEAEDGIMSYAKAIKKVKEVITELGIELKLLKSQYTTEEELALSVKLEQNQAEIDNLVTQKAANSFRLTGLQLGTRLYSDMLSGVKSLNGELDKEIDNINKINDGHKKELKSIVDLRVEIQKIKDERKLAAIEYDDEIIRGLAKVEARWAKHYRKLKRARDSFLKGSLDEERKYFDAISGQEYLNKPPKEKEYISPFGITMAQEVQSSTVLRKQAELSNQIMEQQSNNFDILMAQDVIQRKKYEQETIQFTETMQKLAQQLAFKGGMEQMAKGYDSRGELFEKLNVEVEDRIKLLEVELAHGEDSLQLEKAILQQEKWRVLESAKDNNLGEYHLNLLNSTLNYEIKLLLLAKKQREEKEKVLELEEKIEGFLESGFMSMIDGTKSVTDAFRSMARDVIKELYRILVVQQIVNQAKTAIQSLSGFAFPSASSSLPNYSPPTVSANGNAFNNGKIIPYANGGVVNYPTMFPMSGGKTGLMGEAGPEAILPLKRGPNGKLGVESSGGSVVVNQTINVSTGVAQTVRNEIKTLMPQIAEGAKSAVLDAKRRGGSFGSAFA